MIVVVGQPGHRDAPGIAIAAAQAGGRVQFVTRIADDPAGDQLVQALASAGVGHVATLRQPPPASVLDAGDLDLALKYLTDVSVVVLTDPDAILARIGADAAGWSRGSLVVVVTPGRTVPDDLPSSAIVLEAPATDPEGSFVAIIGDLAVRLDAGADPAVAFTATMADRPAWTPASDD